MKYTAERDCTDFDGKFYEEGEVVELQGNKHSSHLIPIKAAKVEAAREKEESKQEK